MKKLGMIIGIAFALMFMASSAQAAFGNTPYYVFGMAGRGFIYTNSSVITTMRISSFHGTSETWKLYIEKTGDDLPAYDNITISVDCTSGDSAVFSTTDYESWNTYGYLEIPLTYEDDDVAISYNSIPLTAKTVECDFTIVNINRLNNTAPYIRRWIQMIPYLSSIEFVDCTGYDDNFGIQVSTQIDAAVTMMDASWEIAWLVYSIFAVVFVVIGVPMLVFIIIRWALYRITGHRLVERRER